MVMKAKISALIDGELAQEEESGVLDALRAEGEARDGWRRYHLIGDLMRDARLLSGGFSARVAERIEQEPTVLAPAPARRQAPRAQAWTVALAASLAVAFVGASALLIMQQGVEAPAPVAQKSPSPPKEVAQVAPPDSADDYLLAHQSYSPRTSLQGVAPYVRTVSGEARAARR
jgi:sigma-E factor negative regulatory protein RseA